MKNIVFKTTGIFMIFCLLFSVNAFALKEEIVKEGNREYINVTLESGDVLESHAYDATKLISDEEIYENAKPVKNLIVNATGDKPIIINDYAFYGNVGEQLDSISFFGNGEIIIGSLAFSETNLVDVIIPENVVFSDDATDVFSFCNLEKTTIGSDLCPYIFYSCAFLKQVTFTENNDISELPDFAFALCGFEKFDIPKTIVKIGNGVFDDCEWLKEIVIPEKVKEIGNVCFNSTFALSKVVLNEGIEKIGKQAFYDSGLTSVTIPASVKEIGEMAFGYESHYLYPYGGTSVPEKIEGFTIYGYRNTAAEAYAEENGFKFVEIGDVNGVSYNPSWSQVNDYSFNVDGRADKVQVIEANGATRTFTRHLPNVSVTGYDAEGNEVSDMSRELDHEVWTINTKLTADSDLQVHAKYSNEWVKSTYKFRVTTLRSDKTLKSAELSATGGAQGRVGCKIVTGSGVKKVRVEYEDGMTSTYNTTAAALDTSSMTYTYDFTVKTRHSGENIFKIYIKTPNNGWTYATTLTYTAE